MEHMNKIEYAIQLNDMTRREISNLIKELGSTALGSKDLKAVNESLDKLYVAAVVYRRKVLKGERLGTENDRH